MSAKRNNPANPPSGLSHQGKARPAPTQHDQPEETYAKTENEATGDLPAGLHDLPAGETGRAMVAHLQQSAGNRAVQRLLNPQGVSQSAQADNLDEQIEAASADGARLDTGVQQHLEQRLGRDLSSVRVHTGSDADRLAASVDAVAFTTQQDIFFRQGAYDPGSPAGLHLIAHEVAHTIQQSSGPVAGTRTNRGVSISTPNDPFEQQADQVANQVVAPPARQAPTVEAASVVGPAAGTPQIQRLVSTDMAQAADQQQQAQQTQMQTEPPPALRVSNINDLNSARALLTEIEGYQAHMDEGARDGNITGAQLSANETAKSALNDYLFTGGEQGRTLGDFQNHVIRVRSDYARLMAQISTLQASGRIESNVGPEQTATQITQAAGFMDPSNMMGSVTDPNVLAMRVTVQQSHDRLMQASRQVGIQASYASSAVNGVQGAVDRLKQGIPPSSDPTLESEMRQVRASADSFKTWVGRGLEVAQAAALATGPGAAVVGVAGGKEAVSGGRGGLVELMTDAVYGPQIAAIQTQIDAFNTRHRDAVIATNTQELRTAQDALAGRLREFDSAQQTFSEEQTTFRQAMQTFAQMADRARGGGDRFAIVTNVLAEADTFIAQCETTLALGRTEQTAAGRASTARHRLSGTAAAGSTPGTEAMEYYQPYQVYHVSQGHLSYAAIQQTMRMRLLSLDEHPGGAEGEQYGVNPIVNRSIQEIQEYRDLISRLRAPLAAGLGLNFGPAAAVPAGAQ